MIEWEQAVKEDECRLKNKEKRKQRSRRTAVESKKFKLKKATKVKTEQKWSLKEWSYYFGFLLTGPAGAAINNLLLCLTWDLVPGGDVLAGFDAERAPSLPPLSLSVSPGVICVLVFSS